MKKLICVLALFCLFCGCEAIRVAGPVIDKKIEAAHTSFWMMPIWTGETMSYIPMTEKVPERYSVTVRSHEQAGTTNRVVRVSKATYDLLKIGDHFDSEVYK